MKSILTSQSNNILVLSTSGLSIRQIASKTGLGKSTIARVINQNTPNKENIKMGRPSKLTLHDKRALVHRIISGKASNAVQATKVINSIIPTTVSTQTVRNTLKEAKLKAVVKKKKPLLSPVHRKKWLAFALKHQHWTKRTGRGLFGQMSPKSIGWGQMVKFMCGKRHEIHLEKMKWKVLSSLEEVI